MSFDFANDNRSTQKEAMVSVIATLIATMAIDDNELNEVLSTVRTKSADISRVARHVHNNALIPRLSRPFWRHFDAQDASFGVEGLMICVSGLVTGNDFEKAYYNNVITQVAPILPAPYVEAIASKADTPEYGLWGQFLKVLNGVTGSNFGDLKDVDLPYELVTLASGIHKGIKRVQQSVSVSKAIAQDTGAVILALAESGSLNPSTLALVTPNLRSQGYDRRELGFLGGLIAPLVSGAVSLLSGGKGKDLLGGAMDFFGGLFGGGDSNNSTSGQQTQQPTNGTNPLEMLKQWVAEGGEAAKQQIQDVVCDDYNTGQSSQGYPTPPPQQPTSGSNSVTGYPGLENLGF